MLGAEVDAIRQREPDLDAGDLAGFAWPLLVRLLGIAALGVVPLLVVRGSTAANAELVPVVASFALAAICAAVICWLFAILLSGAVVMVLYRTRPAASSRLVMQMLSESFRRIEDSTSALALLALVAGLLSLAFGLPTRSGDELANSVLEDLLAAQLGVLLAALGIAFVAEALRAAADVVDDQSLLLAWPWALLIVCLSWVLATIAGPFEATRMLRILLNDWLPASVDGVPRAEAIEKLVPAGARWWVAFGPLPFIALMWLWEVWRFGGLAQLRQFVRPDDAPAEDR